MARKTTIETEENVIEAANEEVVVKKSVEEENNKIKGTMIYCGPTIKGVIKQYASYTNGVPKRIKEYADSNKSVKRLLVPITDFIETKKNIATKGTVENISFNKILENGGN